MYNFDDIGALFTSVFFCGGLVVGLAIGVAIVYFLSTCYARIPEQHRQMEPGMVWLLLIPFFGFVWMYFVYIRLARSFAAAYAAEGRRDVDSAEPLALAYCICSTCCIVPFLNCLAGPAALVLLVIVLIRFNRLKNELPVPSIG